uniref:Uncharacterized protein n=1 Tax=Sphaerodactylus townsendi TaxID=933632 RepID=A0ACB8FK29_9SAUR
MARRPELLCGVLVVAAAACLAALRVTCSRAKDVTMPAKLPVNFFSSMSPVIDFFLGQLDHADLVRQDSEVTLFFFYAPWCGQSMAARGDIEKVASSLADQVLFVAINCWWNQGKCRKQKHFFYFPVIYLYHRSFGPIEYKGPLNAVYIEKFVRRVMTPLLYISSQSKLQRFLSNYEREKARNDFSPRKLPPGPPCHAGRAREGRIAGAVGGPSRESPARLPPGERPASKSLGGSAKALRRRSLVAEASPSGRPGRCLPLRARTGRMEANAAGGPDPAGASIAAPPEGSPALTVCRRPKPSAAQSSRWDGVGRGGEAAIESVASGGGYLTFFASALHSLHKDSLGTIHFGVITDKLIAKEIPLTNSGSIYLHRHVNASLLYPHEAVNYTAENICRWALENQETFVRWLRPHGGKSLLLNNELKKGPALFLFLPFDPLAEDQPLVDEISRLALAYSSCNRSAPGGPGTNPLAGGGGGTSATASPLQPADPFLPAQPPCCNTVVLPPQLPAISRSHNICELCVNQTVGVKPSHLGGLHCSFVEIEAALDSFYLKERTFVQVVSKTASLCSNFLSSYSPFSYYTACCRTVHSGMRSLFGSPNPPLPPLEMAFSSHGKRWEEGPSPSMPHIEDRNNLLLDSSVPVSDLTGLSCQTNKTLNLYLLDSNLFWTYAERLGAPKLTSPREFAVIVDLKEEVHYVLDQDRALIRSHLETFIRNYSVLYSPLERRLVGSLRSVHSAAQHRIREVATDTFHEVVLRSDKDVVLLYYAPWCGFCAALNHVFIQLARILPDNFIVARVDVSLNDLPWEFMTDHLPNILFFPLQRKDQSVKFPEGFAITLPNLLRFLLRHSSPPSPGAASQPYLQQQGRIAHLEREIQHLRAEAQALREAQTLLRAQLLEARKEKQRLQWESQALRKQHGALQSQWEQLQGLADQKAQELAELAGKLQELAEASKALLAENTLLKFLLASVESKRAAQAEAGLPQEEAGVVVLAAEKDGNAHPEPRLAAEHNKENWTE